MKTPELKLLGLNHWAREFIDATTAVKENVVRSYPCGKQREFERIVSLPVLRTETLESVEVAGGLQVPLHRFHAADGKFYDEYVQQVVKNCNVHVFLALKDSTGNQLPQSVWESWAIGVYSACFCRHTC